SLNDCSVYIPTSRSRPRTIELQHAATISLEVVSVCRHSAQGYKVQEQPSSAACDHDGLMVSGPFRHHPDDILKAGVSEVVGQLLAQERARTAEVVAQRPPIAITLQDETSGSRLVGRTLQRSLSSARAASMAFA